MGESLTLALADIRLDGGTQVRAEINPGVVEEYAGLMQDGVQLPPVEVVYDGADYWLWDGFHRLAAAQYESWLEIEANVQPGTRRDAVLFACGANAGHGLRRTNADKRRAVTLLLDDPEWGDLGPTRIAEIAHVSHQLVSKMIAERQPQECPTEDQAPYGENFVAEVMNSGDEDKAEIQESIAFAPADEEEPWPNAWGGNVAKDEVGIEEGKEEEDLSEKEGENKHAVHFSSDSVEWYTPSDILDRVIRALGSIDLDPCSNAYGEPNVPALRRFTPQDDGLSQEWRGSVFMNPPYGDEVKDWVAKLISEYETGRVTEAVALLPGRPGSEWFLRISQFALCFANGRLRFLQPDGTTGPAPFPSVLVYIGKWWEHGGGHFRDAFQGIGVLHVPWDDSVEVMFCEDENAFCDRCGVAVR